MEHRTELEELLLNGLPDGERRHVVKTAKHVTAEKLRRKRAEDIRDNSIIELLDAEDEYEETRL